MRIAHLPSSYFPESVGGTEVYVETLCQELENLGHHTAIAWHADPASGETAENAFRLPAIVHRRRSDMYLKFKGAEPPGFGDFLRDWKPDLVHFHAFTLGAGNDHAECCRQHDINYVITYHTPAMSCPRGTLLRWGQEPCDGLLNARRCAACSLQGRGWPKSVAQLAALSPVGHRMVPDSPITVRVALPSVLKEAQARWAAFFAGAQHVIACAEFCREVLLTNGVGADRITVERQALPGEDRQRSLRLPVRTQNGEPIRLGYFGRINVDKGADLLPSLIERLRAIGIDAAAEWVGPIDGDRRWAEAMFATGAPYLRYAGLKRGEELAAWIRGCDLIVIPSRCLETGPLTLLEAWNEGTPVIGADRGGIRDFLVANGLPQCRFSAGDAVEMADGVRRMLAWNAPAPLVHVPGMRSLAARMLGVYQGACQSGDEGSNARLALDGQPVAVAGVAGGRAT